MTGEHESRKARIGVVTFSAGDGGNDRMLVRLARGLNDHGCAVDFITRTAQAPYLAELPTGVRRIVLHEKSVRDRTHALYRYVRHNQPDVLLSGKRSDQETVKAVRMAQAPTRVFFRVGTTLSARNENQGLLKNWWRMRRMRRLFPQADGIIAVSYGVARDVQRLLGIPSERIHVVANPVVTPEMLTATPPPPRHPFYTSPREAPVIMGMGGLRHAKDFPTLLRAFAMVVRSRPARLIILGKGRLLENLKALSRSLAVERWTDFPGFVENPYGYLAHADLFVLSSLWEGSPNVLTEALAMGTPVVATDCPSGPREILQNGYYGRLVPCGDPQAMAQAILEALENRPDPSFLKQAVVRYTLQASIRQHLMAFGLLRGEHTQTSDSPAGERWNPTERP